VPLKVSNDAGDVEINYTRIVISYTGTQKWKSTEYSNILLAYSRLVLTNVYGWVYISTHTCKIT